MRLLSTGGSCNINPLSLVIGQRVSKWNTSVFLGSYQPDIEAGTLKGLVLANRRGSELVMERLTSNTAKLFERTARQVIEEAPRAFVPQPKTQIVSVTFSPGISLEKGDELLDDDLELVSPRSQLFFTGGEWEISTDPRGDNFYVFRSGDRYVDFGELPIAQRQMNIYTGFFPKNAPRYSTPSGVGAFFLSGILSSRIQARCNMQFATESCLGELREFLQIGESPLGILAFEALKRISGFYNGLKGAQLEDEIETTISYKKTRRHIVHDKDSIVRDLTPASEFWVTINDRERQKHEMHGSIGVNSRGNFSSKKEVGIEVDITAPENQSDFRLTGDLRTIWDICMRQHQISPL